MKKIFVVFVQELDGKRYAVANTIRTGEDLAVYLRRFNSKICHLCESCTEAAYLAEEWNASFRMNGTALF